MLKVVYATQFCGTRNDDDFITINKDLGIKN